MNIDPVYLEQFLECYTARDQAEFQKKMDWFFFRTCAELERRDASKCTGQMTLSPLQHLLSFAEYAYRGMGLDKVFPVKQEIKIVQDEICNKKIPPSFDGFRMLWLSDLHLDIGRDNEITDAICESVKGLAPDLLVYGGDYRCGHGSFLSEQEKKVFASIKRITQAAKPFQSVALLGNHDLAEMVPYLRAVGIPTLLNEGMKIERGSDTISFVGLDDSYRFFHPQVITTLEENIDTRLFNTVLTHNHHIAERAAAAGADLLLAGHTHAGQFKCKAQDWFLRKYFGFDEKSSGRWHCGNMTGYTNAGIASSAIPIRTVESEAHMITLKPQTSEF